MSSSPTEVEEQPEPQQTAVREAAANIDVEATGFAGLGEFLSEFVTQATDPSTQLGQSILTLKAWKSVPLDVKFSTNSLEAVRKAYLDYQVDPEFANQMLQRSWALMSSPEIIMGTRIEHGGQLIPSMEGPSDIVLEALFAEQSVIDYEKVEDGLMESPLVSEWITMHRHEFRQDEKDIMWTALAALEPRFRTRVVALAEQYLREGELDTEDKRRAFVVSFWNWARQRQQEQFAQDTGLGTFGRIVSAPFHFAVEGIQDTVVRAAVGPDEYRWRDPLSLGQNVAIGLGADPSDPMRWHMMSGSIDFLANFTLDPFNWAFGVGIAAKMSRTVAVTDKLADMNKLTRAARVAVPWAGKKITNLPRFSRSPTTRIAWSFMAKTHDDLVKRADAAGVFRAMHNIVKGGGGVQELVEVFPMLRGSAEGVGQLLTSPKGVEVGPSWYREIIRWTAGPGAPETGMAKLLAFAQQDMADASTRFNARLTAALQDGAISLEGLVGAVDGVHVDQVYKLRLGGIDSAAELGEWSDDVTDLVGQFVVLQGDEIGEGAVVAFRGDGPPQLLDMSNPDNVRDLMGWLGRHPARDSELPELTVEAAQEVNAGLKSVDDLGALPKGAMPSDEFRSMVIDDKFLLRATVDVEDLPSRFIGWRTTIKGEQHTFLTRGAATVAMEKSRKGRKPIQAVRLRRQDVTDLGEGGRVIHRGRGVEVTEAFNFKSGRPRNAALGNETLQRIAAMHGDEAVEALTDLWRTPFPRGRVAPVEEAPLSGPEMVKLGGFHDRMADIGRSAAGNEDISARQVAQALAQESLVARGAGEEMVVFATKDEGDGILRVALSPGVDGVTPIRVRTSDIIADLGVLTGDDALEGQFLIRAADGQLTSQLTARSAVNRLESTLLDIAGGGVTDIDATMLAARLMHDPEMQAILYRYTEARGYDLIGTQAAATVTPSGANKVVRATHRLGAEDVSSALSEQKFRMIQAQARLNRLQSDNPGRTWFIKDMPTRVPTRFMKYVSGGWRRHGPVNPEGWWGNFKRAVGTRLFNPKNPGVIAIDHGEEGARALAVFLRRLGVSRETINAISNRYIASPRGERYNIIREAIEQGAQEVDHPLLQYAIIEHINKQGLRSYAYDAAEREIAVVSRRGTSGVGEQVAVPVFPSHLTGYVQLPGQHVFSSLRRYRRAKRKFRVLPKFVRGVPGSKASKNRKRLLNDFRHRESLQHFDDDTLQAMAYAMTRPRREFNLATRKFEKVPNSDLPSGLGVFARAGQGVDRLYSAFHSGFSIMQLAARPIAWPMRVLLEEQWRAAFFDLPSLFRNPARQLSAWHESYLVSRAKTWRIQQLRNLRSVSDDIFGGLRQGATADDALEAIGRVVPEFSQLIPEGTRFGSPRGVRATFESIMAKELLDNGNMNLLRNANLSNSAMRRARKLQKANAKLEKLGFDLTFDWSDIHEIRNKGFTQLLIEDAAVSGAMPVVYKATGMTDSALYNYGTSYSRILHQAVDDPILGFYGLGRATLRGGHGNMGRFSAKRLVRTRAWQDVKVNVRRLAEEAAKDGSTRPGSATAARALTNDVALADWYLVNVVDPHIDNLFSPLWGNDPAARIEIANQIRRTKTVSFRSHNRDYTFNFDRGGLHTLASDIRQFVTDMHGVNRGSGAESVKFPPKLSAFFEARYLGENLKDAVRPHALRRLTRFIMSVSGDTISQHMNRRPAYLSVFKDHLKYYRGLGFSEDMARIASHQKAVETVNYVFYNMENVVPFLKAMNKASPFFSAWWEVAQTWTYKIPALSAWGVGYPMLVRKVDRIIQGLISTGLLRVEEDVDPRSGTRTRQMFFEFAADPDTGNPFGDVLSEMGFHAWKAPTVALSHMLGILNLGTDPAHGDAWDEKDVWRMAVGSPIDPFSHGLGGVNQVYIGTNPLVGRAATGAVNLLSEAADMKRVKADGRQTLSELAAELDVNVSELMVTNSGRIEEALGDELAERLFAGDADPSAVTLPAGTVVKIPRSSLWLTLMENFALPFGSIESDRGAIWGIQPSWTQQMLRAFGLYHGGPGTNPADTDDPDAVHEILAGFVNMMQPNTSRAAVSSELMAALQYLEHDEGLLTQQMEAAAAAQRILDQAEGELIQQAIDGESVIINHDHPLAEEFQAAKDRAEALDDEILARATDIAQGNLFLRGLTGLTSPVMPQQLWSHQRETELFWFGRDAQEALDGDGDLTDIALPSLKINGEENAQAFRVLLGNWLEGGGSTANREFLRAHFPELWPFTFGKSFWGPAGEPPEIKSIDDWSEQLKSGLREPYPMDVFAQVLQRGAIGFSTEVDVAAQFGKSGNEQAFNILANFYDYQEIRRDRDVLYSALDHQDEWFNHGAYLEWKERNADDNVTLFSELNKFSDNITDVVAELTAEDTVDVLDMSTDERTDFVSDLRRIARGLRDTLAEWEEQFQDAPEYRRPRDAIIARYFSEHVATYYEGWADLFEFVDRARDSEEESLAWDRITEYENTVGMQPIVIDGEEYPSILEWRWNSLSPESKEIKIRKWTVSPPEWLSLFSAQRLVAARPAIAPFIPETAEEQQPYAKYSFDRIRVAELLEDGLITQHQRDEANEQLERELYETLIDQDRGEEIVWRERLYPAAKLDMIGELPLALQKYVPMANAVHEKLEGIDRGPSSDPARQAWAYLLDLIQLDAETDPRISDALDEIGDQLYDTVNYDQIIMRLFAGSTSNAAEL